jgi:hypothetical protein
VHTAMLFPASNPFAEAPFLCFWQYLTETPV